MREENRLALSRRQVLGGLGAVGAASAGAGLGTTALFADEESFDGNSIEAGDLNLVVDYYTDRVKDGAVTGNDSGQINGDGATQYTYSVTDVKPGDEGTLAFCPKVVGNPGYVWIGSVGGLTGAENGQTEPEAAVDIMPGGDLGDAVEVTVSYAGSVSQDAGTGEVTCNDTRELDNRDGYALADLAKDLGSGFQLDGDEPGDGDGTLDAYPGSADTDDQRGPCLCVEWELPADVGNEVQSDSLNLDFTFAAVQERNNADPNNPFVDITVGTTSDFDYNSIQAAVDAASGGDVVSVGPGTYREHVAVDTGVTLVAQQGATPTVESPDGGGTKDTTNGAETGTTFLVKADDVCIDGFEIRNRVGNNWRFSWNQCISTDGTIRNLTIRNNLIQEVGTGNDARGNASAIVVQPKGGALAENVEIVNNVVRNVRGKVHPDPPPFPNWFPTGILVSTNPGGKDTVGAAGTVRNLVVRDNEIHDIAGPVSAQGIQLHYRVQDVEIQNNRIYDIRGDPDDDFTGESWDVNGDGTPDKSAPAADSATAIQLSKGGGSVGGPLNDVRIEGNYLSADSAPADLTGVAPEEQDDQATPGFALKIAGFTEPASVTLRENALAAPGGVINENGADTTTGAGTTVEGGAVDARRNWWGASDGPSSVGADPPYQSAGGGATADGGGALVVDFDEDGVAEIDFDEFLSSSPVPAP